MEKISLNDLESTLQAAPRVILDFNSPGCAPCKKVAAVLEELEQETRGQAIPLRIYSVDISLEPAIAQKFFILGVPTLILFKQGKEIARLNSVPKKEKLLQLLA